MAVSVVFGIAIVFSDDSYQSFVDGLLWLVLVPLSFGWLLLTIVDSHTLWHWAQRAVATREGGAIPHFSTEVLAFTESNLPQAAIVARLLDEAIGERESAVLVMLADLRAHNRLGLPPPATRVRIPVPIPSMARFDIMAAYRHMVADARQGLSSASIPSDADVYKWIVAIEKMRAELRELAGHCEDAYIAYRKTSLSAVDAEAYKEALASARAAASETASTYDKLRVEFG